MLHKSRHIDRSQGKGGHARSGEAPFQSEADGIKENRGEEEDFVLALVTACNITYNRY